MDRRSLTTSIEQWPPELELLRASGRLHMRDEDRDRASRAVRRVDWDRVVAVAAAHGLLPLLHRHVAAGDITVPPEPAATIRDKTAASAMRSLRLTSELLKLLRLCADREISVVPLKGPVLAQQVYGSVALRRYRDLDLLFKASDLPALEQLLTEHGYCLQRNHAEKMDDLVRQKMHHLCFTAPAGNYRLEAHYYLIPAYGARRFDWDTIASRLQVSSFLGVPVRVLPPEDQLVYLCQHGAGHAWSGLEWLVAVAELARRHVRDWDRVATLSSALGEGRRVQSAMLLASEIFGDMEGLPGEVVSGEGVSGEGVSGEGAPGEGSARWSTTAANGAVLRRLAREPSRVIPLISERFWYQLGTDEDLAAQLGRCWTTLAFPTAADAFGIMLPRWMWPLYYAVRPVRLGLHHAGRLIAGGGHSRRHSPHSLVG
jgi:hypothetical protein